jgi:hypothetical protein
MRMLRLVQFLQAIIDNCFAADIVDLDQAHQMWTFLRDHYEPTGPSIYLAPIHQE